MKLLDRVIEIAADPTGTDHFVGVSAHPNIGRAKVASVGVRIADAINNCQLAVIKKLLHIGHVWVESCQCANYPGN